MGKNENMRDRTEKLRDRNTSGQKIVVLMGDITIQHMLHRSFSAHCTHVQRRVDSV